MRFQTQDGLWLEYEIKGEGHPILCLPGLTRNASDFEDFAKAFKPKAQIIALTSRGRMPSDYDPNYQNYNILQEGQDALALLDHLQIPSALWLGTSRGGLITMVLAPKNKSRMKAAIFNDIGPELNIEGLMRIIDYLGVEPSFQTIDQAAEIFAREQALRFPDVSFEGWRQIVGRWFLFEGGKAHLRYDPKLRDAVLEGSAEIDLWEGFKALSDRPLGVIWGANSDLLTQNEILKMQENRPGLNIAKIPNRGHVPFLNEPEALNLIENIFHQAFS